MSNKDLPAVKDIRQRDGAVTAPSVQGVMVINEDDEVVGCSLVEHLGGGVVVARHLGSM